MEETKKVKVLPSDENAQTAIWQDFGWSLVSSQEIKNTDSHLERRGDTIYNVTTKENYVNLLFKRDTNMPHYSEIVALERKYDAVPSNIYPKKGTGLAVLLTIIGIPALIAGISVAADGGQIIGLFVGLGFIAGGVLKFIFGRKKYNKEMAQNEVNNSARTKYRTESRKLI